MPAPHARWWSKIRKPAFRIYPIIIILLIPILLIANTLWNLHSFNRDANFIVSHQAVSIADTIAPLIQSNMDIAALSAIIQNIPKSNSDILSIVILKKEAEAFFVYIS